MGDFFRHYRDFGDISFLVVNDCSNDHTAELLHSAPDVTVFQPTKDSTYARHNGNGDKRFLIFLELTVGA